MANRKRKLLNLEQRVKVIKQNENGVSCRAIAKKMQISTVKLVNLKDHVGILSSQCLEFTLNIGRIDSIIPLYITNCITK